MLISRPLELPQSLVTTNNVRKEASIALVLSKTEQQFRDTGVPRLRATEHIPARDKVIHLHFFFGACDWYVAEYDGDDLFYGYAVLNGDINSEWGYFTLSELLDISIHGLEVDHNLYWKPTPAEDIDASGTGCDTGIGTTSL